MIQPCLMIPPLQAALAVAMTLLACATADVVEARPVVLVTFDVAQLPPNFQASALRIQEQLEREAVSILDRTYPPVNWTSPGTAEAPADPDGVLTLKLVVAPGVNQRIYVDCLFHVRGQSDAPLSFEGPTLYTTQEPLPAPARSEEDAVLRGRAALRTLFGANYSDQWFAECYRNVPLARDVLAVKPRLVIPVQAIEIRAHPDSILEALVQTKQMKSGRFELSPIGPDTDTARTGMQRCKIKNYTIGDLDGSDWDDQIESLFVDKLTVAVHIKFFKLDYPTFSPNP